MPDQIARQIGSKVRTVDISVDAADRLEVPQPIQNLGSPEIACVPQLVAFGEMPENSIVQKSVGVGEQANSHSSGYAPLFGLRRGGESSKANGEIALP